LLASGRRRQKTEKHTAQKKQRKTFYIALRTATATFAACWLLVLLLLAGL
jgi:hypothetical protein